MTDSLTCIAGHSTPRLIVRPAAADTTDEMVRFVNRRFQERRRLTVRRVRSRDGYRLVVTYPDGLRRLHTFPDDATLVAGTAALQAQLAAEGWEPLRRSGPLRRPAVRPLGQEIAP